MEGILAIVMTFGMPVMIVGISKYFRFRNRQLDLEQRKLELGQGSATAPKQLAAAQSEKPNPVSGKRKIFNIELRASTSGSLGRALEDRLLDGNSRPDAALGEKLEAELDAVKEEKRLLEARVQNLETIVCSVDFELNQRLNRLAAEASRAGLLSVPAHAPAALPSAALPSAAPSALPDPSTAATIGLGGAGELRAGQVLVNRYTIEREIGRGGMGAVYLARDSQLGERVALKVVSSTLAGDPAGAAERFRREVAAARKITHPNVIRIHDLGQDGATLFLSMEYVDGPSLAAHLRGRTLPLDEARSLLYQIASGVAAAHAAGVIHRDLKPQNVLLARNGSGTEAKVIDFGLASASFFAGMTATGVILGTPEYMAPEQVRGKPCDARTDVYALGAIGYHLLAGRPPFAGDTPIAVAFAQISAEPPPLASARPDVSAPLAQAVARAMSKDPAQRFHDAAELRAAIG